MSNPANSATATTKQKVFLVDDHPLVREWLTNLINQQPDLEVCGEAEGGPEARQGITRTNPDIAIIDISLKDSSGIELIKDLKECCPRVAVLVLSMHEELHYAERSLRAGARGYIVKRETTRNVVAAIHQVLEGKLYVSEAMAVALAGRFVSGKRIPSQSPVEQLSDRELEVFQLLGQGRGTRQISENLHLSVKTVQAYCARIKDKLQLSSATELLREAVRWHESKHPE
jgi:DNA-binding NarL/FixJ family response regulator